MSATKPTTKAPTKRRGFFLSPTHAVSRLLVSSSAGIIAYALYSPDDVEWWMRAIVGWDVMALTLVGLAWSVILRADNTETKRRAGGDDPGRHLVFGVALVSSMFSFFAAAFVLRHVKALPSGTPQLTWTLLTLAAIVLSWILAHTVYTLRYAHLFYRHGLHKCLQFPGDELPSDIDFAYFAFTVGMCFQVSDVVVATTQARRAVLLHAMLSFVYNTAIVALALNLVFAAMT